MLMNIRSRNQNRYKGNMAEKTEADKKSRIYQERGKKIGLKYIV